MFLSCRLPGYGIGVTNVVIPRKGRPSPARRAEEHRRSFRRIVEWRAGSKGRISYLKRAYGWDRAPHRWQRRHPGPDTESSLTT
jgi:IS5 family transposase